jgi:threonine dehydrogenase-like Zn-dependent dehydrogenase
MRALCWYGTRDVRVESVPDPQILNPRDAIVRVTSAAICGSDLHLYNGYNPAMREGDILGHEFMGEIVEVGPGVESLRAGERVVVPFCIACGRCFYCARELWSLCDNSNPNAAAAEAMYGYTTSGLFGYSHLTGGYAGGQAQYVRVPFADVGAFPVPDDLDDEAVLLLGDVLPTAWMAAESCAIRPGDVVAIWGAGPVGLLAISCALLLGAERVISIDRFAERLARARALGADTLDYEVERDVVEALKERTAGRGPDACIDAVGTEAHGSGLLALGDRIKQAMMLTSDRPTALRQVLQACRKGGTVSVPGAYLGFADTIPVGAFMEKGLTLRTGQTHVHRYVRPLLQRIVNGDLDATRIITHRMPLEEAPAGYDLFLHKKDDCIKVVLKP